jgi:hypothetical protein
MDPSPETQDVQDVEWQKSLLPLMSRMIIVLSAFFFIASLAQVIYLEYAISITPTFDSREALSLLPSQPDSTDHLIEETKIKSLVMLEGNMADNLYHQAHILLMARIWTSYISFVTGMILALVGATFVLGKLKESQTEVGAKGNLGEISIKSASPGLVLAVLGTALMLATILTRHESQTSHQAIYVHGLSQYPWDKSSMISDTMINPNLPQPNINPHND